METHFAPAKRTDRRKFENQIYDVSHNPIMDTLLKTMSGMMVVLNEDRQIISLNHAFLEAIGIADINDVFGLRLGESLNCIHSFKKPHGCGTTEYCSTCGAAIAMMAAINQDKIEEQICTITSQKEGIKDDISLMIRAQPIMVENNRWILVFAQDITQHQFWTNLEKVFFHDINNMLTSLLGNSELLAMKMPESTEIQQIKDASERLCREIKIQKTLSQYKDVKYLLRKTTTSLFKIKKELSLIIDGHKSTENKLIDDTWPPENIQLYTDTLLVSRILGNMVINALEATIDGDLIQLRTHAEQNYIEWEVWNRKFIPENIQRRIFQRHYSTKSNYGRGLGTYSMKLFGEGHLKGKISFKSSVDEGTTFIFKLPRKS